MNKQDALTAVMDANEELQAAQTAAKEAQDRFGEVCRSAYDAGLNDREMAEATGYSRARIQQYRKGDSRKRKASV